jgi:RNA polymerase sigma factor (sigma-70 family)
MNSCEMATRRAAGRAGPKDGWNGRAARWGRLMVDAREGDDRSYRQLLRELDIWLRRYYARRLPRPAADDAKQEALLALHANRHTYISSEPFGPWVLAIARNKWVDRVRDASRHSALCLDEEIPIEDHGRAVMSAAALDCLLARLKPAQENVIRLVKLEGFSVSLASNVTGQSASLVKINIHRGLKKLSAFVS